MGKRAGRQVAPLRPHLLHQGAEAGRLARLPELGAGAHDRDEVAIGFQEAKRVHDMVDVALPVERGIHDDPVIEAVGIGPHVEEVGLPDPAIDPLLPQAAGELALQLDAIDEAAELDAFPGENAGPGTGAPGR